MKRLWRIKLGYVSLQAKVKVRRTGTFDGEPIAKTIDTTVGRVISNQSVPQNLGYVDRTDKEHCLDLEIEFTVDKKQLAKIIERCFQRYDTTRTATMLDEIKRLGFMYSTRGAITVSVSGHERCRKKNRRCWPRRMSRFPKCRACITAGY